MMATATTMATTGFHFDKAREREQADETKQKQTLHFQLLRSAKHRW